MKVLVFRYEKHILFYFLDTKWRHGSTLEKSCFFLHTCPALPLQVTIFEQAQKNQTFF